MLENHLLYEALGEEAKQQTPGEIEAEIVLYAKANAETDSGLVAESAPQANLR